MRVRQYLFIIDSTGVGGVEKRFSYLFKYLAQSPFPVDSSDFLVNNKLFEEIESYQTPVLNDKIRLFTFGIRIKSSNRILAGLIYLIEYFGVLSFRLLKSRKYDSLVFVTTKSLKYRNLFRCKNKIIVVYAYTINQKSKSYRLFVNIARDNYTFDCLSERISKVIRTINRIRSTQVVTSPNSFIDYAGTINKFEDKENTVAFVSRFETIKGVDLLLSVLDYVIPRQKSIKFFIIGYGPLENKIIHHIKERDFNNSVIVIYTPDPKEILVKSKIFLSLQLEENYPSQSLLEAMACNNAVIATDVGLTYKLVDEYTGKRVRTDPVEIGESIIDLFGDEKKLSQLCFNARERVIKTHTVENYYGYLRMLGNTECL